MIIARKVQTVLSLVKCDNQIVISSRLCSGIHSHNTLQNDCVPKTPCAFVPSKDYLQHNKYMSFIRTPASMNEYNIVDKCNRQEVSASYLKIPKDVLHCGSGTILTRTNSFKPHYTSTRQVSSDSTSTLGVLGGMMSETKGVALMQDSLLWIHSTVGLPWWATAIVATITIRTAMTLPLTIHQLSVVAKLEHMQAEMAKIDPILVKQVQLETKKLKLTQKEARLKYLRVYKQKKDEIIVRDNCHPAKVSILVLVQIPLWITLSFSLRNLCYMAPKFDQSAILTYVELGEGGIGWIHNLTEIDPYYILPILLGVSNLSILEIHMMLKKSPDTTFQKCVTYFMRGISVIMVPIAASVPAILSLYWTTSSVYGLVQKCMSVSPKVRRFVGIPHAPSEHEHPYRTLWLKVQERLGIKGKPEITVMRK